MDPTFIGACKRLEYNLDISSKFFTKRRYCFSAFRVNNRHLLSNSLFSLLVFYICFLYVINKFMNVYKCSDIVL